MPKSNSRKSTKPAKPYKDFPLFAHANGWWCKKIRGRFHYFGPWRDPDGALKLYVQQRDDLYAGRQPRPGGDGLELHDVLNAFLTAKQRKVDAGELALKTFGGYHATCTRLVTAFGCRRLVDDLHAEDFGKLRAQLAKVRGAVALGNEVQRVRSVFKHGYDAGLIDNPVRFGPEFVKLSAKAMRQARQARGERMLEPNDIRNLLQVASVQMKAMILLGVNAGFGNSDVSSLPLSAVDLDAAAIAYPRPKTAVPRRVVLWPETVTALLEVINVRKPAKDPEGEGLVFLTRCGARWVRQNGHGVSIDSIGLEFGKLLRRTNVTCSGLFYVLRHVFRTIADETRDYPAIDLIMGHEESARMATRYRERIDDKRLKAVTDHVRNWLLESGKI